MKKYIFSNAHPAKNTLFTFLAGWALIA